MTESNEHEKKEEIETLALCEVFHGVFDMFIGVQSEKYRERQFKYGKFHQFLIVGIFVTLLFFVHLCQHF